MLLTRYAPFRRSINTIANINRPRLACVKPAASVHPEPGSNSSLYSLFLAPYYIDAILPIYNKKVLLLVLGTCCTYLSIFSMNNPLKKKQFLSQTGCKDKDFFFLSKHFNKKIILKN